MPPILLATETNVSRAPQLSNTALINFMVEKQAPDAKSQAPLFGTPGIKPFTTAGPTTTINRGQWEMNGVAYAVQGDRLLEIDANGTAKLQGVGIEGTGLVGMNDNGVQLIIVNGARGWIFTQATGAFQPITDPGFYPCNTVEFMDGYFIMERLGTNQFFLSNLYDGTTYDALAFATAEAKSGFTTRCVQNLQLLFIFTTTHIELWYDAGTETFPFQRYAGGVINYGCEAPFSIIDTQDGALFFLGADKVYYRLQANVPIRISTHAIEHLINLEATPALTECFTLTIEGHKLIFMTLVSSNVTVCYDISTGKWHTRQSYDAEFNSLGRWRARTALECYDKIIVGDVFNNSLGLLDWQTYTEYGNPIIGTIQTVNQHKGRKRVFCGKFEIEVQAGVGLTTGQGSDPQMMLRRSTNGGMTWGKIQPWRSMGKAGEYNKLLRWFKQGSGRQMMWQLSVSDPVPRTVIMADADITFGM